MWTTFWLGYKGWVEPVVRSLPFKWLLFPFEDRIPSVSRWALKCLASRFLAWTNAHRTGCPDA